MSCEVGDKNPAPNNDFSKSLAWGKLGTVAIYGFIMGYASLLSDQSAQPWMMSSQAAKFNVVFDIADLYHSTVDTVSKWYKVIDNVQKGNTKG